MAENTENRVEWYVREYEMRNGQCEKVKYMVLLDGAVRTGTRKHSRAVNQAEKNAAEAAREAARILNNNFEADPDKSEDERDRYLTMDYSDDGLRKLAKRAGIAQEDIDSFLASALAEGESPEQEENRLMLYLAAEKEAENFMKRCRRACKAAGVELRRFYATSDRDGKELTPERVHHHMVVNREAAEICARCWTAGGCLPRVLWGRHHGDLSELAEYMIAQVRNIPGKNRYHPSRNLEKPVPGPRRPASNPDRPLEVPTGCEFIWRSESHAGRPQVLRYYRPPEKRRKKRKTKTEHTGGIADE